MDLSRKRKKSFCRWVQKVNGTSYFIPALILPLNGEKGLPALPSLSWAGQESRRLDSRSKRLALFLFHSSSQYGRPRRRPNRGLTTFLSVHCSFAYSGQ